ncbi:DUF2183 domain-containing protein [Corynebacterium glucuronolyticum]|uniref:DUF2183 domain-containing protein n=1 Tax=Corynebacterium glucuronolyticum TaxID=39791 RepID=A0A7T4EHB8_9CORY|nr:phosphatase domain-containing protein [Corynebacterium glucuronolyticum]QQB47395.1 DUF2183 domain-containing protein [Corynebacterium glucuronolyticum]WKD64271.1 hypothetical protein CGLUCO_10165 [Corynebacterium glucuronolyticum DSM 44120]SMB78271.1 Phosphatidate phosphatase APP1 [Corynebacterium glucuronolyticum]
MALADIARRVEALTNKIGTARSTRAGWRPAITGFSGYGSRHKAHILGRVLMEDPTLDADYSPIIPPGAHTALGLVDDFFESAHRASKEAQRGFRQFFTIQVGDLPVSVTCGNKTVTTRTNPNGYIDVTVFDHGLEPGWHEVRIEAENAKPVTGRVLIISDETEVGLISDIDDTIMVTNLPRSLQAAYVSWVQYTNARKPVPGMGDFYQHVLGNHPHAPVFYLSTGAWNTYEMLETFLTLHKLPVGPMLLTDWGPTPTGLFRSGQEHKKVQLRNLMLEFPQIRWILVGDDGQHDPLIYGEAMVDHPERVAGVAIRELSRREHVLSHGSLSSMVQRDLSLPQDIPTITAQDGYTLIQEYQRTPFV